MKRIYISITILVLVLLVGVMFLYLGPTLHLGKKHQMLDSLMLHDGSKLILLQTANSTFFEPYTVLLYRAYVDGRVERCGVGYEEPYWWFGTLKLKQTNLVELHTWGEVVCTYNIEEKVLSWVDHSYPDQEPGS